MTAMDYLALARTLRKQFGDCREARWAEEKAADMGRNCICRRCSDYISHYDLYDPPERCEECYETIEECEREGVCELSGDCDGCFEANRFCVCSSTGDRDDATD